MKLARWTWQDRKRRPQTTFGVVRDDRTLVDLNKLFEGKAGVADLLTQEAMGAIARAIETDPGDGLLAEVQLQPPLARPGKILCVGVNYPERNAEYKDGSEAPNYPSLFVRFPESLVGHESAIVRPPESTQFDYEGEIVLVIGKSGRRIPEAQAHEHIFGLTMMNEGSMRDWLRHGKFNVTQGKNFDRSGSVGPWIVPKADAPALDDLTIITRVNGEERQRGHTGSLIFSFARIVSYVSTFTTLEPGDLIATGTPSGAGARFDPPKWLVPGDVVEVECPGVGVLRNTVEDEVLG